MTVRHCCELIDCCARNYPSASTGQARWLKRRLSGQERKPLVSARRLRRSAVHVIDEKAPLRTGAERLLGHS